MTNYDREFWTSGSKHEQLAMEFERNIELVTPNGHFECEYAWGGHCPYCASNASRPKYTGPSI